MIAQEFPEKVNIFLALVVKFAVSEKKFHYFGYFDLLVQLALFSSELGQKVVFYPLGWSDKLLCKRKVKKMYFSLAVGSLVENINWTTTDFLKKLQVTKENL